MRRNSRAEYPQEVGYSTETDLSIPRVLDEANNPQPQVGFASGGYALYQLDDDMDEDAGRRESANYYHGEYTTANSYDTQNGAGYEGQYDDNQNNLGYEGQHENQNGFGYDRHNHNQNNEDYEGHYEHQNDAGYDGHYEGSYAEQQSDALPDGGVSYYEPDAAAEANVPEKDIVGEWSHAPTAVELDSAASKLRRPALSFGFGGKLVLGCSSDVVVIPGSSIHQERQKDAILGPLLGNANAPSDEELQDIASRIRSLGTTEGLCIEDGLLPGATRILHEALSAFVLCRGKRVERIVLSKRALEGCFETVLIDILASSQLASPIVQSVAESSSPPIEPAAQEELDRLLLLGNQENAVAHAVKFGLWPQAFVIANHVSAAAYRRVVSDYCNQNKQKASLTSFTLQLLAGRGVDAVRDFPQLDKNWAVLLRCILANRCANHVAVLRALGDRLWVDFKSIAGAHLCYIAASDDCLEPSDRVMLIGGDHINIPKGGFVTPLTIERTEAFLYAQSLSYSVSATPRFSQALNEFVPFRLVQAMLLAEQGQLELAQQWLASIDSLVSQNLVGLEDIVREQCENFRARINGVPFTHGFTSPVFQNPLSEGSKAFSVRLMSAMGEEDDDDVNDSFVSKRPLTPPAFDVTIMSPAPNTSKAAMVESPFPEVKAKPVKPDEDDNAGNSDPFARSSKSSEPFAKPSNSVEEPSGDIPNGNPFAAAARPRPPLMAPGASPFVARRPEPIRSASAPLPSQQPSNDAGSAPPAVPSKPSQQPVSVAPPAPSAGANPAEAEKAAEASSSGGGWSSWDLRGWLVQRILGVPKNATVAKTGDKLTAYYDENQKRWIFPGDPVDSGPGGSDAPPIDDLGEKSSATGAGTGAVATPQRPGAARSRYVVAT